MAIETHRLGINQRERVNDYQFLYKPTGPAELSNQQAQAATQTATPAPAPTDLNQGATVEPTCDNIVYDDVAEQQDDQQPKYRDRHHCHCDRMCNDEKYQVEFTANFNYYLNSVNQNPSLMGCYGNYGMNFGMGMDVSFTPDPSYQGNIGNIGNFGGYGYQQIPYPGSYNASPYYGVNNSSLLNNIMTGTNNGYSNYMNNLSGLQGYSPYAGPQGYDQNFNNLFGMNAAQNYGANTAGGSGNGISWPQISTGSNAYNFMVDGNLSALGSGSSAEIQSMIDQLNQLKNDYGTNVEQIEQQIGTLTEQLQQRQQEKNQLESTRSQKEQQYNQLGVQAQQAQSQQAQLTNQAQQLQAQKAQLTGQIASLTEGIASLTAGITAMETQAAALSSNPATAAAGAAMLAQVAQMKAQLVMMQTQLAQAQVQSQQVDVQSQQVAAQLQQVQQTFSQVQQQMQGVSQEVAQIDQQLSVINQEISYLSQQINQGLNTLVERKTDMAMIDARQNNIGYYGQMMQSQIPGVNLNGYTDKADPNGFLNKMNYGSNTTNILNGVSLIGGLFGLNAAGGGLLNFFK